MVKAPNAKVSNQRAGGNSARTKVFPHRLTGIVTQWKGQLGFIQPSAPIKHPKYVGKLYFGQEDVEQELSGVGATVNFFVYSDAKGLGAMHVRPGVAVKQQQFVKTTSSTPQAKSGKNVATKSEKGVAEKGVKLSPARVSGVVQAWKGKFGYITPSQKIKHPDAVKNNGNVYFGAEDVEEELSGVGAHVTFILYKNNQGLHACHVRPGKAGAATQQQQPTQQSQKKGKAMAGKGAPAAAGVKKQHLKAKNENTRTVTLGKTALQQKKKNSATKVDKGPSGPDLPRQRISKTLVTGEVVKFINIFGWIQPTKPLGRPDDEKRGGKLYFHKKDVAEGTSLAPGARVKFFVYQDASGLGAEVVSAA